MFSNISLNTSEINTESIPMFALVGYQANSERSQNSTMRLFPIKNGKLKAETPISFDSLKAVFEIFQNIKTEKKELSFKGIIPQNVVSFKNNAIEKKIIWTVKPSKKYLLFSDDLAIENGYYNLPKLVFELNKNTLSVFSVKNEILNENSKLYHAPFLNVYKSGNICMGSASLDISSFSYVEDVILYAENHFFNSVFTHTNHNKIIKENIVEYLKKTKDTDIIFDEKILLENGKTLIDLI